MSKLAFIHTIKMKRERDCCQVLKNKYNVKVMYVIYRKSFPLTPLNFPRHMTYEPAVLIDQ